MKWLAPLVLLVAVCLPLRADFFLGGPTHDGETVDVELPPSQHLLNKGGTDGAGLCVFTSIDHAARWCQCLQLIGMRDYMTNYPGGGYPAKVDEYIKKMARDMNMDVPRYVQHTGGNPAFLSAALEAQRYPCVTYSGHDGVLYRGVIAHMVNIVHLSDKWAVIHDNNYPGKYLWMDRNAFIQRWREGGGWSVVLLDAPPPPVPVNAKTLQDYYRERDRYERSVGGFGPPVDMWELPEDSDGWQPYRHGPIMPDDGYRWRITDNDPDHLYLYFNKVEVGGYDMNRQVYMALDDGKWTVAKPPFDLPLQEKTEPVDDGPVTVLKVFGKSNHGLNVDAIDGAARDGYEIVDGVRVTADDTLKAVSVKPKFFVTYVGKDKTTAKQFLTTMKDLKDVAVHAYTSDEWAPSGVGLADGVTVQRWAPSGTSPVLFRVRDNVDRPTLVGYLRRIDPSYDPSKDIEYPDQSKPAPAPAPSNDVNCWLILGAIGVTGWAMKKHKNGEM